MKITIYQNREVYKEESKIGNDSENKVETLEFEFPEEYRDFTKYIEFQIKGEKYVDLIEDNKYVITREVAKYGKIKTQVVLKKNTENDVMIFKSDVFTLTVSNSINATENLIYTVGVDLIEKIVTKNNEQDTRLDALEADNTTNKENISNLQNDNTTNKTNIKSLQDDNEVNKTDISNIKQEQTTQNTNISNLQTDNTSNKSKIEALEAKNTEQDTSIQTNTESIEQIKSKDITQDSLIEQLQAENTKLKKEINSMQIPGEATGNPIHLTDSSDLECEIVPISGTEQEVTVQGNNYFNDSTAKGIVIGSSTNLMPPVAIEIEDGTYISQIFFTDGTMPSNANISLTLYKEDGTGITVSNAAAKALTSEYKTIKVAINSSGLTEYAGKTISGVMLVKSSTAPTIYEEFTPNSPSPEYPSEIVTVGQNGSVEIEVCNKNLAKINESAWELTENNTIKNKAQNNGAVLATFKLRKGQTANINLVLLSRPSVSTTFSMYKNGKEYVNGAFNNFQGFSLNTIYTRTITATEDIQITSKLWGNANSDIFEFQFWAEIDETTDYIPHESYTKTLPIQKEFVKIGDVEDTFVKVDGKWYEAHYHPKIVFDGREDWSTRAGGTSYAYMLNNVFDNNQAVGICSHWNFISGGSTSSQANECIASANTNTSLSVFTNNSNLATLEQFKAWLAQQYANGIPVIVYYILATPELIPCTEEQSEILNSFYTYKGITNISVDGIGKIKIIYKQDQQTINKNYENRLAALEEYSTEEQVVGKWIDGKTLYKKTIIATSPTVETDGTAVNVYIDISSLNAKFIGVLNAYSILDTGDIIGLPYTNNSGRVFRTYANTMTQRLLIGTNSTSFSRKTCYITLIYTKTTD